MLEKNTGRFAKLSLGLASLVGGNPVGAAIVAEAGAGFYSGLVEKGKKPEAIFLAVLEDRRRAWAPRFGNMRDREAVEAVLMGEKAAVLNGRDLVKDAFTELGMIDAATPRIVAALGITAAQGFEPVAVDYATDLIRAGLTAALDALYPDLAGVIAYEQARQIGALREQVAHNREENAGGIAEILSALKSQTYDEMLEVARRFRFGGEKATLLGLREFLSKTAENYHSLLAEFAAPGDLDGHVSIVLEGAREALRLGKFDEARARIEIERASIRAERTLRALRDEAKFYRIEGESFLLEGNTERAIECFESEAELFSGVDRVEEAKLREASADRLFAHARQYGGPAYAAAEMAYRRNLDVWDAHGAPENWARTRIGLASVLRSRASRTSDHDEANAWLEDARQRAVDALRVLDDKENWSDWHDGMHFLASICSDMAGRNPGTGRTELAEQALSLDRQRLARISKGALPDIYADVQTSIGSKLSNLGLCYEPPASIKSLREAIETFSEAQEFWSRDAWPLQWAAVEQDKSIALLRRGQLRSGVAGQFDLRKAAKGFSQALKIFSPDENGRQWAEASAALGEAHFGLACQTMDRGLLVLAQMSYDAALPKLKNLGMHAQYEEYRRDRDLVIRYLSGEEPFD